MAEPDENLNSGALDATENSDQTIPREENSSVACVGKTLAELANGNKTEIDGANEPVDDTVTKVCVATTDDDSKLSTVHSDFPVIGNSNNGLNNISIVSSDADVDENANGDQVLNFDSANDVLNYALAVHHDPDLVSQADYVLGACSDENCSYTEGYKKRQALYSCLTCCPESSGEPAGVCLACSLHCHDGHTLVELYCKRLFRCDCGNSKFTGFECKLEPQKAVVNENNKYNDNFWGKYCFCKRPFPDPDVPEAEADNAEYGMHQCLVCEDWYHLKCMGISPSDQAVTAPSSEAAQLVNAETSLSGHIEAAHGVITEDAEGNELQLLCNGCCARHPFLSLYVEAFKQSDKSGSFNASNVANDAWWRDNIVRPSAVVAASASTANDNNGAVVESNNIKNAAFVCYLQRLKSLFPAVEGQQNDGHQIDAKTVPVKPLFFDDDWLRMHLCSCSACMGMYVEHDVAYLCDADDSYTNYYEKSMECKRKREDDLSNMSDAESASNLTKMLWRRQNGGTIKPVDPVVEVIMANAIGKFRRGFAEFVNARAEEGKVIGAEEIKDFTDNLRKKLRTDMENSTPARDCG